MPKPLRYFLERDAQYRVAQTLTAAALFFSVTASVITLAAFNRRDEPEGESDHDPS